MNTVLLLISTFCYSLAIPASNFGGRIIGGDDIPIEEAPYQVSLQRDGAHNCGGSIIAPSYIVTAAHCTFQYTESQLSIRAGSSVRGNGGQVVNVKTIYNHPQYDGMVDYDISILELDEDLVYSDKIAAIELPSSSQTWPEGTKALTSGWGFTQPGEMSFATNLQGLVLDVVDQETCNDIYKGYYTDRMLCASSDVGKGACTSDSGGPLQIDGILAGVVSFTSGGCASSYPDGFANVPVLRDFIEEVTGL